MIPTLERLLSLESFGIKFGLANIRALCAELGHPERAFATLHVAGTNGKGSVTAMAHEALRQAGIRAARYTSPHLAHLNERFLIGDAAVTDDELEAVAAYVLDVAGALVTDGRLETPPTFFEATTAIGFELFRRAGVSVAVIEVGLGGRLDATNVVTPVASAITSIAFDHQEYLGHSLAEIAAEKAGIIKPGVPVVLGEIPAEAAAVIRAAAAQSGSRVIAAHEDVSLETQARNGRTVLSLETPDYRYTGVTLGLQGDHQIGNALVTVRLLEQARAAGMPVTFEAIARGLAKVSWPARLETLAFADGRRLLLDAAHNPDGAAALASYLRRWHPERPPLVFAAMRDKDVRAIFTRLQPAVGPVVATLAPTSRAMPPDELAAIVREVSPATPVAMEPDPVRAVARAWEDAPLACVAGSIFLVGAVRDALYPRAMVDSSD